MCRSVIFSLALLAGAIAHAQDVMPAEMVTRIKHATAYLRVEGPFAGEEEKSSGSGFLIHTDGRTGFLITNEHVVFQPRGDALFSPAPTIQVVFRSGTRHEATARARIVARWPERDLVLLKVQEVEDLPAPLTISPGAEPFETMTVYIFGFPFGEILAMGKGNPPVNVARGQVSSLRRDAADHLRAVLIDGALNPGNSGGPVVDVQGRLIGVATATIRGANIGFAVASPSLLDFLAGRAERPEVTLERIEGGNARLRVEVALLDPLQRLKSAELLYREGTASFSRTFATESDKDPLLDTDSPIPFGRRSDEVAPVFGPIEDARVVPLSIRNRRASGLLELPAPGDRLTVWCQVRYNDGADKTVLGRPARLLLSSAGDSGWTFWGEVIDPDDDCRLELVDGALEGEVPGSLHDLNVEISRNNAPRVLRPVQGDFQAQVKVAGSFHPGPVRTGPRSVPFNGAGLVLWLDDGNYVRLERAAMYRGDQVLGLLMFESREHGATTQQHNLGRLDPSDDLWLRLVRKGDELSANFSRDGHDWEPLDPMRLDWPSRLLVGLDLVNSCGDPMTARFSDYRVKPRPAPAVGSESPDIPIIP